MKRRRFGRIHLPDERDYGYLACAHHPYKRSTATSKFYQDWRWSGDQGFTSKCVGFAAAHWIEDGPIRPGGSRVPFISPNTIYREAQNRDGFPLPHEGSTVRAAARYLAERGLIESYWWAFDLDDMLQTVLQLGPMVLGIDWYEGMAQPDSSGRIHIEGECVGGHAIECNGVSIPKRYFRLKNSWGKEWGYNGHAKLSFDDAERLLDEQGEAMIGLELRPT